MAEVASWSRPARVSRMTSAMRARSLSFIPSPSSRLKRGLMDSIGKRGSDRGAGVQSAEDKDRVNRGKRKLSRHIVGDACQTQHVDLKFLSGRLQCLQVLARVALQAEHHRLPGHGLLDHFCMRGKLVADGRADEVG